LKIPQKEITILKLEEFISGLPAKEIIGNAAVEVKGVAYHSQSVQPGYLFAAIRGLREEGRRFIPDALSRGAGSVLVDEPLDDIGVAQVVVPNVREALARLACAFYGDPSSSLTLVGITGTNGKTTTSYLIESIFAAAEKNVGVMGTVNYRYQKETAPAPTTTPESLDLQRNLQAMRQAGVTHAVLEVSSHALDLERVRGCHFDAALFTNLTRDHLDYHGSMEKYFQAKQLLFTQLLAESGKERKFSVINVDDPWGRKLLPVAGGSLWRYGIDTPGEIWPQQMEESAEGWRARVSTPRGPLEIHSPLIGKHNLYNILAAVSAAEALGFSAEAIAAGIAKLSRIPGRLERIPGGEKIRVFVDYAHTGDALARALQTLRRGTRGQLILVFGCGGDRDRGKRAIMGKIAAEASDLAVLTSDNPRTEDPVKIIEEVEKGMRETPREKYQPGAWMWQRAKARSGGTGYVVIADRKEAIGWAIRAARPGDVVLIAGKGHENYQILGRETVPFDDREEAAQALISIGG
jgi:UDP-N-acetylmuramoyl-L-alanyl-D-glutamate--2,6-diaminopimelate ligase